MNKTNLNETLAKIQRELKAPKNQFNKFGNYHYRSCEDILEGVKPLLGDCTLIITDEPQIIGSRFYIKATVTLTNGTESISNFAFAREPEFKKGMDESQITGAASSYARKYALNGLFAIDDTKDADATETHGNKEPKMITEKQMETLNILIENKAVNLEEFFGYYKVKKVEELTQAKAAHAINVLQQRPNAGAVADEEIH